MSGGSAGELFLKIEIAPDSRFRIEGSDLYTTLPITPWEAALGGEAEVVTPDRRRCGCESRPAPSSGRKIRLRGGVLRRPAAARGDLLAEIRDRRAPESLSNDRERELFQELRGGEVSEPSRELSSRPRRL